MLRPLLPRKLAVCNGVVTRRQRLLDATDVHPNYESTLVAATVWAVEAGDDVVVIGGGYGVTAVRAAWAARNVDVRCYEPSDEHAAIIAETAALNGVGSAVTVEHAAVGPVVQAYGPTDGADRVGPADLPECDVLVMDCEGAERAILDELAVRPRALVVESHGAVGSPPPVVAGLLDAAGYAIDSRVVDDETDGIEVFAATREDAPPVASDSGPADHSVPEEAPS